MNHFLTDQAARTAQNGGDAIWMQYQYVRCEDSCTNHTTIRACILCIRHLQDLLPSWFHPKELHGFGLYLKLRIQTARCHLCPREPAPTELRVQRTCKVDEGAAAMPVAAERWGAHTVDGVFCTTRKYTESLLVALLQGVSIHLQSVGQLIRSNWWSESTNSLQTLLHPPL